MVASVRVTVAVVAIFCVPWSRCSAEERSTPLLKAGPLEQFASRLRTLVTAPEKLPGVSEPVTREAIDQAVQKSQDVILLRILAADGDAEPVHWDDFVHLHRLRHLQYRLVHLPTPTTEAHRATILYLNGDLTRSAICTHEIKLLFEILNRYFALKRQHQVQFDAEREAALLSRLAETETLIATRLQISRTLLLLTEAKRLPAAPDRKIDSAVKLARSRLPLDLQESGEDDLRKKADELVVKIYTLPGLNEVSDAYRELLLTRMTQAHKLEGELAVKKKEPAERRELCRKRTVCTAELADYVSRMLAWNAEFLRLSSTQHHFGLPKVGDAPTDATPGEYLQVKSPRLDHFDKESAGRIARIKSSLVAVEKSLQPDFGTHLEHWWVKSGRELPYRVLDALVDDMATWLKDMPAARKTLKEEIRSIAGYPNDKTDYQHLTAEEQRRIQLEFNRSIKDIKAMFDRSRVDQILEDLTLVEELQKAYPSRTLASVAAPNWPQAPQARLTLGACYDLPNESAAAAHLLAHRQLAKDIELLAAEQQKYFVRLNLNVSMHMRAAAGER